MNLEIYAITSNTWHKLWEGILVTNTLDSIAFISKCIYIYYILTNSIHVTFALLDRDWYDLPSYCTDEDTIDKHSQQQ